MTGIDAFRRQRALDRLGSEEFDVLVVGGGITGAGVALDAAARGLKTALVEARDFASGTSSRSSKLVHGGLRYLQQREYRLVYENLYERQRLLDNAPHLVRPLPFLIPLFGRGGVVDRTVAKAYSTALWLYDLTGGIRIGRRHKRLSRQDALGHVPTLDPDLLVAAFLYWDAQADDARLTLAVLRTAVVDHGAVAVNHVPVEALVADPDGRVRTARLADGTAVRAKAIVNATGVWADAVASLEGAARPSAIRPAKGIHVTVRRDVLPCDLAVVLPVPKDRRSIFVVPWGDDHVYIGTTDTDYDGPLDEPRCTPDDLAYVLRAVNAFVTQPVEAGDVTGTWAGLRPLVKDGGSERTADLSRRHVVTTSPGGVVSVTGGKLTTYRKMAEDTVDAVAGVLGRRLRRSPTRQLRLHGADGHDRSIPPAAAAGLGTADLEHLVARYGGEASAVVAMVAAEPSLGERLVEGLPYLRAEGVFAARYEMAHTLEDVLGRRTRALLLDAERTAAAAPSVAALVGRELGWDEHEQRRQVEGLLELANRERSAADLPPLEASAG